MNQLLYYFKRVKRSSPIERIWPRWRWSVSVLQSQTAGLGQQIAELGVELQKLIEAESRLSNKVESFRAKKETIKA